MWACVTCSHRPCPPTAPWTTPRQPYARAHVRAHVRMAASLAARLRFSTPLSTVLPAQPRVTPHRAATPRPPDDPPSCATQRLAGCTVWAYSSSSSLSCSSTQFRLSISHWGCMICSCDAICNAGRGARSQWWSVVVAWLGRPAVARRSRTADRGQHCVEQASVGRASG